MSDIETVKDRSDIVAVVGETVQLRKAGRNFKGLCPFHNEKSASFMVSPDRQSYMCFGCQESGDVYSFVMKRDGSDFGEALRMLAVKAGVTLTTKTGGDGKKRQRLLEAVDTAAKYFQAAYAHDAGKVARDYVEARGLSKATVKEFGIGYAPNDYNAMVTALKGKGFTEQELEDAGLIGRSSRGPYARFRHRLMIPIADASGAIRGFTGRVLEEGAKEAKYVNTPDTSLYHKGRLVYALHIAKQPIVEADGTVLVEGQMDVISAHQAGTKQVVAVSGTAMTEDQLRLLSRFSTTLLLALDADGAGVKAMHRIIQLVGDRDFELKVVDLGVAKDPDELIQQGVAQWQAAVENAEPVIDFLLRCALARHEAPYSREAIKDVLADVLPALSFRGQIDQDYYLEQLSQALQIDKSSIRTELGKKHAKPATSGDTRGRRHPGKETPYR